MCGKEYYQQNKTYFKVYYQQYYIDNREFLNNRANLYYRENKEKYKDYVEKNKVKNQLYHREYYLKNKHKYIKPKKESKEKKNPPMKKNYTNIILTFD